METLRTARTIGIEDLPVSEPARPPAPDVTLELACGRWARLRGRVPRLELTSDHLVLTAPAHLPEPLEVERGRVAAALVDTRFRDGGETLRFPYAHEYDWSAECSGDEAEIYGWLYRRGGRPALPLLMDPCDLPNLAVLFTEPIAGRPGFLTRVADPELARSAVRDWGVMRQLTVADAERAGIPVAAP